jgi:hypothetical protein
LRSAAVVSEGGLFPESFSLPPQAGDKSRLLRRLLRRLTALVRVTFVVESIVAGKDSLSLQTELASGMVMNHLEQFSGALGVPICKLQDICDER